MMPVLYVIMQDQTRPATMGARGQSHS